LITPSTCAHFGSLLRGKKVPATRKSGVRTALTTYEKFSIDFANPATVIPKQPQPKPASHAISGTANLSPRGGSPKNIATIIGTQP
jgi:hypothetical protein